MKIIEPTHKEIMQFLDCCFYGRWHKGKCEFIVADNLGVAMSTLKNN